MSYTYAQKKRTAPPTDARSVGGKSGGAMESAIPNSVRLAMLEAGQTAPTAADKGHRVDLPEAMRAKMESSFGMDFSAVKLYESEMLGQTGAEAMAQGNEIAFAPGKLDFSSMEGQARLGHELSHVASQARGEVHGNGFLLDSGLEARADREGAMAARGESVYGNDYGGAVAPLSSASPASMDGPMQATSGDKKKEDSAIQSESDKIDYIHHDPVPKEQIGLKSALSPIKAASQAVKAGAKWKGFGAIPLLSTGMMNVGEYAKNLDSKISSITSGKKAEMHKDFMSNKRKTEIANRGFWDTYKMMDLDDYDDDDDGPIVHNDNADGPIVHNDDDDEKYE